jgi:hypothetical protein
VELFIQRQNERDADGCAAMLVDDDDIRGPASAYGAVGKDNVRNALAAWIELHPGLHYTWKNVKVEGPKGGDFIVTFDFERRCDDESRWGRWTGDGDAGWDVSAREERGGARAEAGRRRGKARRLASSTRTSGVPSGL